jgi:hypothetical protein
MYKSGDNSWGAAQGRKQQQDETFQTLNDIDQGKHNGKFTDQLKIIMDASKSGLISDGDKKKLVQAAMAKQSADLADQQEKSKTVLDHVMDVTSIPAKIVVGVGDSVNTFGNGIAADVNYVANDINGNHKKTQDAVIAHTLAAQDLTRKANAGGPLTPEYKAKLLRQVQAETNMAKIAKDQQTADHADVATNADPWKMAGAGGNILLNVAMLGTGGAAAEAGKAGVDLAIEGGSKLALEQIAKQGIKQVAIGTVQGGLGSGASVLEQKGKDTTWNDLAPALATGAITGAIFAGGSYLAGKGLGAIFSHFKANNVTPSDVMAMTPEDYQKSISTKTDAVPLDVAKTELGQVKTTIADTGKSVDGIKPIPFGDKTAAPTAVPEVAPSTGSKSMFEAIPTVAAGDVKAAPLAKQYINGQYDEIAQKVKVAGDALDKHDTALIPQIENAKAMSSTEAAARVEAIAQQAHNPEAFKTAVAALKEFADTRLTNDKFLGRTMNERQNYLSRFYERPTGAAGEALDRLKLVKGDKLPGYVKDRTIATQAEAEALAAMKNPDGSLMYPHLKLRNANVFEDAQQAISMAKSDHGKQAIKLALEQAHPGVKIGNGQIGYDAGTGVTYKALTMPGAKGLSAPESIADFYNRRANPEVPKDIFGIKLKDGNIVPVRDNEIIQQLKATGGQLVDPATGKSLHSNIVSRALRSAEKHPVGAYDTINANLKYSILGGGTFHAVTTAGSVAGQQVMRAVAHPLQIPGMIGDNVKLAIGTLSKASHETQMADYVATGQKGFADMVGVITRAKDILGDANVNWLDKVKDSSANPIKAIHDMVFDRQIPEAKMMILKQSMLSKFKGMDFHAPTAEQVAYGRDVASAVNNLGGINRAVEGLSPKVAKNLSRVLLATDFTEGKFRILGNAVTSLGPKGNIARQMIVGKSLLFAIPGLTAMTVAGKLDWNNGDEVRQAIWNQLMDPSIPVDEKGSANKTNPNGTNQAIHFPSTYLSELGKILKPALDPLSPNKFQGAIDYATNRSAAAIGVGSRLIQNKDFFGNPIYGQDANGNDMTPLQVAGNVANQVSPIPLVQGAKTVLNGQNIRDSALNTLGLRVSNDANSASGIHSAAVNDFYNTWGMAQSAKSKVVKQINALVASGNTSQAVRKAEEHNATIEGRLKPFKDKYSSHYNPAWDDEFKTLNISVKPGAMKQRSKDLQLNSKLLSPDY